MVLYSSGSLSIHLTSHSGKLVMLSNQFSPNFLLGYGHITTPAYIRPHYQRGLYAAILPAQFINGHTTSAAYTRPYHQRGLDKAILPARRSHGDCKQMMMTHSETFGLHLLERRRSRPLGAKCSRYSHFFEIYIPDLSLNSKQQLLFVILVKVLNVSPWDLYKGSDHQWRIQTSTFGTGCWYAQPLLLLLGGFLFFMISCRNYYKSET